MPIGWKSELKTLGSGNLSQGVCTAIAKGLGWDYGAVPGSRRSAPNYVCDVASALPVATVRRLIADSNLPVTARTVEKSKLQSVVLVENTTNGETSVTPADHKGRDRRTIKELERKIRRLVEDAV